MTTKAEETKSTKDTKDTKADEEPTVDQDVVDNPKIQIEPGMGELLGGDLVKIDEDGNVVVADEDVPEPAYDLNDRNTMKPLHNKD